ncbi:MAG: transporter, partial [Stenotrophomonas sp.]
MSEPFVYALRFLLYVDLMLLFGVPLFARSQRLAPLLGWRSCGLLLAVGGLAIVLLDATLRVSTLLDIAPDALGVDDLAWFIGATTTGRAALVRGAVLAVLLLLLLPRRQHPRQLLPQTALAAIALASLAWNGHAGAGEYLQGWPRLLAGIIHLLAA